ncbi:MAG: MFS transporter [Clostridia bacterium]|nr:MFS transporter [Clostridia bacterium]
MKKQIFRRNILHGMNPAQTTLIKLILMECFYWFAWSFGQYQTVYLQGKGMDSAYIGTLNAVASVVAIVAMTIWGIIADRINSVKKTLLIVMVLSAVMFGAIGFLPASVKFAAAMFMVYCPLANFSRGSINTLLDNFTVRNCAVYRINYGAIRSIGSFTFAVGSVLLSALIIPAIGVKYTFVLFAIGLIPAFLTVLSSPDPKSPVRKEKKEKVNPKALFKNYYYVTFIVFVLIVYIPFMSEYSFLSYYMEAKGIATGQLGTILALRAIMEMPFLIFMAKLRKHFKLKYLMMVAATLIGIECFCLGTFAGGFKSVAALTSIFGMGNGILIGTTSNYLFKLAPDNLKATAQTIFGSTTALAGFIGNLGGGYLFKIIGAEKFYLMLSGIIFVGVIFFILSFIFYKKESNPGDILD